MRVVTAESAADRARIGARLRAARLSQQMTIKQVAEASGVTEGFISRLERDMTSPSVATLLALCDVLAIDAGALLSRSDATYVRLEDAPKLPTVPEGSVERLLSPRREHSIKVVHSRMEPGAAAASSSYALNAEVHFVHVISGAMTVTLSDQSWSMAAGDSLTFDGKEPHRWEAATETGCEALWFLTLAPVG